MKNTKSAPKRWIKIVGAVLVVFLIVYGYGYYWYSGVFTKEKEANAILDEFSILQNKEEMFEKLYTVISYENTRCQEFISQKEGDFGSFEYCKKFVNWVQGEKLLQK